MRKILVVDDDTEITKLLLIKLTKEGYDVITAGDAYQGNQYARAEKPDLIVLDIMLPAGGGYSLLKNIRSMPRGVLIPIVILTGMKDEALRQKIEKEGVEAYLQKPCEYAVISETIKKLLGT